VSKADEVKDHTIKELRKELSSVKSELQDLAGAVPLGAIADSLEAKAAVLACDDFRSSELMTDPDTLKDFIKETASMLKTAKFLNKLLDKQD
jgi:hypothetical protein